LRRLGASLLVTTHQAGKLVIVRDEGEHPNTHYRAFPSPMGLALAEGGAKLAIGTSLQVWEFRDVPDAARRLEPSGRHDACFIPRSSHVTGNVLIHEMAYHAGGQLWFVNTRFSCLATLDPESSFTPRWRPPAKRNSRGFQSLRSIVRRSANAGATSADPTDARKWASGHGLGSHQSSRSPVRGLSPSFTAVGRSVWRG
jgi:hypothetical protein